MDRIHTDWSKKSTYAANIIYISSMCLSELSVVLFVWNITPVQKDRQLLFGLGSVTILWTVIGVIVSAAECHSPTPWDYFKGGCINRVCIVSLPKSKI